jgi:hypothetical protein
MGFHHHYVHGPKLMPRLLGGASAATVLLGAEADGLSIDFTDASLVVRDTTTTSNAYNGNVQTFWRDRSFTSYASPSPKITRDSDGYYKYRPHNLASMSEAMHLTARWPTSLMTVTGNATTAPDGTSTATQFAETAVAGTPGSLSSISVTANVFYTASVYLKMNQIRYVCVAVAATASGAGGSATFDLQAGTVTQSGVSSGGGTFGSAAIENIGSGWYRCSVSASQTTATVYHVMSPATTGTPTVDAYGRENYTGNASNSFYAWGAQLNAGPTALTYTKTQAHNLCLQSADLATTWVNNNTTETTNSTAAPDGTTTADTLTESGAVATHSIYGPTNLTLAAGLTYTASVYLKQGTQRYASLRGEDTTAAAGEVYPWVTADLQAGTLTANGAVTSSAITGVGNGWYRVSVTWVQGPTLSATGNIVIALSNVATAVATTDNLGNSYDGTGALNIYVWGAQVELASSAGKYVATTTAAVYSNFYDLPREWDSSGACQGLLVEEARTNLCLYSTQFDNAAWTATRLTVSANATTAPDGTTTADKLVLDATAASEHRVAQSVVYGAAAYVASVFAKAAELSWIALYTSAVGGAGKTAYFNLSNGTAGTVSAGLTATITAAGNGWYRCAIAFTASAGAAEGVQVVLAEGDGDSTIDGNSTSGVYVWGAQVEAGAFVTSPIYTGSASVTRAADDPIAAMASTISATVGTIYAKASLVALPNASTWGGFGMWGSGTSDMATLYFNASTGVPHFYIKVGAAAQAAITLSGAVTPGTDLKVAGSWEANDFQAARGGALGTADTSGTVPTLARLRLGNSDSSQYTGYIKQIMYLPREMSDAELQTVTT